MPLNITAATDSHGHYNLMPVYGKIYCGAVTEIVYIYLYFYYQG